MNTHRKTDPEDERDAPEKEIGKKLYRLMNRYGAEEAKIIITEVRNSIMDNSRDEGQCPKIEIQDTALEEMYRDYVASGTSTALNFIEYKSLVKLITYMAAD